MATKMVSVAVALLLLATSCGGGESGRAPVPEGPCVVGRIHDIPIETKVSGRRPPEVDAEQFQTQWPIKHVVFLMKENRTFDNFFAVFPGANGSTTGKVMGKKVELRPCLRQIIPTDLLHDYPMALRSWNKGKMDGFACVQQPDLRERPVPLKVVFSPDCKISDYKRAEAYSRASPEDIPNYWHWAETFTLADNFFTSALGPSFPNHLFSIAAQSAGTHDNPTETAQGVQRRQQRGFQKSWGCDAPISTKVGVETRAGTVKQVHPCFDIRTLGDEMNEAGIPWASYAATSRQDGYIWSAYDAIRHIRETDQWEKRLFPVDQLVSDIEENRLPPVTWVTPRFLYSDHPDVNLCDGENWSTQVINSIMESDMWKDTAIFITWDDWGGFYDHVAPKQIDRFGLGFRAPLMVISPYAKKGFIDHEPGEFSSVLRFVEDNWGLGQLTGRDREANNLTQHFDFSQEPREPDPLPMREDCQRARTRQVI
ncbi:MAG: alkaline phosphatase family protein [Actinomycetota bacterium]